MAVRTAMYQMAIDAIHHTTGAMATGASEVVFFGAGGRQGLPLLTPTQNESQTSLAIWPQSGSMESGTWKGLTKRWILVICGVLWGNARMPQTVGGLVGRRIAPRVQIPRHLTTISAESTAAWRAAAGI